MKTAISLPDDLFARADELARQTGKTRSELYRDALGEYLHRHDPQAVTRALDAALGELGERRDAWVADAARRALDRTEW
jgi:metal-responsive CopG/Arc/MetJ family transcriptional regulator